MTPSKTLAVTPAHARQLIADALTRDANRFRLITDPYRSLDSVAEPDVALLHALADSVSGWTHTTRLREWLDAKQTFELRAAYLDAINVGTEGAQ